jgi:putative transposase
LLAEAASILTSPVPNWRTLARWHKRYNQHGRNLLALIPSHQSKGNARSRMTSSEELLFEQAFHRYSVPEKPSIQSAYDIYTHFVKKENESIIENHLKTISYKAFYNRVKKHSKYLAIKSRDGLYSANNEFRTIGSYKQPQRVMERVEIDHTPLDLILLDDESLVPIGRPNLTLLIDVYSHCIVGFNLNFFQPGYESVRNALLNCISPKDYTRIKYPMIEHDWPCHGKPETLVVDNGVEFWSTSLEQSCLELGINIQYNPVRKPWLKPMIERVFGTINRKLLDNIPGKTFSNIIKKGDYDPQKNAFIRFSTFLEIFHHWIIDIYHYEPDSRKRYIPVISWQHGSKLIPPATIIGNDLATLEIILSISLKCLHKRGGIERHYLRYDSDELAFYRMRYPGKGKKFVLVKFNPRDISYVYVFITEINKYIRVPCIDPDGYTKGLSLQEHLITLHLHKTFIGSKIDTASLAKSRSYIKERVEKELIDVSKTIKAKKYKGGKNIAKYFNIGSQNCNNIVQDPTADKNESAPPEKLDDDWDSFTSGLDPY